MDTATPAAQVDEQKLVDLAHKVAADVACALTVLLGFIGDESDVYRTLKDMGRARAGELAARAKVDPRYLLEWLSAQAAAGYVTFHPEDETFSLSPEQAIVFAEEGHPACAVGFFQIAVSQFVTHQTALQTFQSGAGRPWGEHDNCLFCGTDRFFRPGYVANLVGGWLPALDGMVTRLEKGAKVADLGCGHGSSTILMAGAFPNSTFHGIDFHAPSIAAATAEAGAAGVSGNTRFSVAGAADYPETGFDLACMFDSLHDMGDPVGVARHIGKSLKPDGALMLVEPLAGDRLEENLHVLGQIFYSASTLICTPAAKAQGATQLGAQAGQKRLTKILNEAGFSQVRRVAETETNMVLEAKL